MTGISGRGFIGNGGPYVLSMSTIPSIHRGEDRAKTLDEELGQWWHDKAEEEVHGVVPKAEEYGSVDLEIVGFALRQLRASNGEIPTSNAELGIAFYLLGKVARVIGAYADGRSPSDDTWHDMAVYTKMGQRVRETDGRWPR